ncbi:MAG TPA: hypothetical protein VE993_02005 [Stellaceae bacterium]|nr:hypothetical protein [Stellaceae bacterium]
MTGAHLVGSIGLDTVPEVFATVGQFLGPYLKRVPDGEIGGRRLWISWQYPLLRANPFLQAEGVPSGSGVGFPAMRIADDVKPEEIRFSELGYAREARASYIDFLAARERGELPRRIRFQVCLPTPYAAIVSFCTPESYPKILPAYEAAMLREAVSICAAIPHEDLCLQWDVCHEMLTWGGRWPRRPAFPDMERQFAGAFTRLAAAVPTDVELGFHLCYGDFEGRHFVEPEDATKMVELADLILSCVAHEVAYIHMPVPIARDDDAYYAPLQNLKRPPATELYLGLVHARDGVEGAKRRMATARRHVPGFGIASECGIARARKPEVVIEFLRVYAGAAAEG